MTISLIVLLLLATITWIYNRLVKDRNQVQAAWSDIDVQLKRRHDLVPQLVTSVKAYASFETSTREAVTALRTRSESSAHLPDKAQLETQMTAAIDKIIVLAEAYPELKADENFRQLQTELVQIEDHIQYARRFYNGAVRIFNTRVEMFPYNLVAKIFGYKQAEFFEADNAQQREAQKVEL